MKVQKICTRLAAILTVTVLTAGAQASVAAAAGETFMYQQSLSAGNAYASYTARPYVNYTALYTNHTGCPGIASGYGGYTSTPFSGVHNTGYYGSDCGYGYADSSFNPVSGNLHGAVYNPNISTFDYLSYADYYWS